MVKYFKRDTSNSFGSFKIVQYQLIFLFLGRYTDGELSKHEATQGRHMVLIVSIRINYTSNRVLSLVSSDGGTPYAFLLDS